MTARSLAPILLLAAACATSRPALREPEAPAPSEIRFSGVDFHYYDVDGVSAHDLREEMNLKSPIQEDGKGFDAHTDWHVDWEFPFRHLPDSCSVGPLKVTVTVRYDLPHWISEAAGEAPLRGRWTRYLAALVTHENGHRDHGLNAAREIGSALPLLPPRPTCDEAGSIANDLAHRIIDRYGKLDVTYDSETDHGATQGALFR